MTWQLMKRIWNFRKLMTSSAEKFQISCRDFTWKSDQICKEFLHVTTKASTFFFSRLGWEMCMLPDGAQNNLLGAGRKYYNFYSRFTFYAILFLFFCMSYYCIGLSEVMTHFCNENQKKHVMTFPTTQYILTYIHMNLQIGVLCSKTCIEGQPVGSVG